MLGSTTDSTYVFDASCMTVSTSYDTHRPLCRLGFQNVELNGLHSIHASPPQDERSERIDGM